MAKEAHQAACLVKRVYQRALPCRSKAVAGHPLVQVGVTVLCITTTGGAHARASVTLWIDVLLFLKLVGSVEWSSERACR